jgi:large subunit ribosomal protein L29
MANAKATELRELGDDELSTRLVEARQELFNLRFQHVTGQLDNYSRLNQLKKDIARIETLVRENENAPAEAAEAEADAEWRANQARSARVAGSRKNEGESDG